MEKEMEKVQQLVKDIDQHLYFCNKSFAQCKRELEQAVRLIEEARKSLSRE